MIQPHSSFETIRPDEVAECWDGVYHNKQVSDLYEQLWGLTEQYDNKHRDNIEDIGPHDVIGINSVKSFWDKLSEPAQMELNRLALEQGRI